MTLKTTASVAGIFNLIYALLNTVRYVQFLSLAYSKESWHGLIVWPLGILANLSIAVFLFHLVSKQKAEKE